MKCCILFLFFDGLFSTVSAYSAAQVPSTPTLCESIPRTTSFHLPIDNERRREINLNNSHLRQKGMDGDYTHLSFEYDYNELIVSGSRNKEKGEEEGKLRKITIVLLIQPIGVGIGRWYYDRLLNELSTLVQNEESDDGRELIFLAPDLLGCGSACNPSVTTLTLDPEKKRLVNDERHSNTHLTKLPLFRVDDWADQLTDLMVTYESDLRSKRNIDEKKKTSGSGPMRREEYNWCITSNGGCVPIALEIGKRYKNGQLLSKGGGDENITGINPVVTNLILSATPSVDSLFSVQDVDKVQKSYKTLSGLPGSLFWWYALRKNGKFIQNFSEKNLASRKENLGENWTPQCVMTAKAFKGRSRYSTFAFLAGSLNGGNTERLKALGGEDAMIIDVITGGDTRRNRARSWFWDRRPKKVDDDDAQISMTSLVPKLEENGNSGQEYFVGGRRCPAHEDAEGFSRTLMKIILGKGGNEFANNTAK